jgi:penicillin-binding protein 1B
MKRAITLRQYANPKPFDAPDGVVTVTIDSQTGLRASPSCSSKTSEEIFVAGTEPTGYCGKGGGTTVSAWDTAPSAEPINRAQTYVPGPPRRGADTPATAQVRRAAPGTTGRTVANNPTVTQAPEPEQKKKGFFAHIKDIFR